ncbi:MAG: tetratricopeptide repeat protein [Verrucomicrobiae bacterium]|nr:tetratricopeptide repeat protein [Verrucomicrobiae bacterium]
MCGVSIEKKFLTLECNWVYIALIVILGVFLYAPVVYFEFIIYDDPDYITLNPLVLKGLTWEGVKWAFFNIHGEKTYWHPLTWLAHMLDCELFGANPSAHHIVNLLLAVLNALLVYVLIWKITSSKWKGFIVGVFFLVHPVQIETVAWISERKNLLTCFFALLTLIFYVKYTRCLKLNYYVLVLLSFILCLMAKPALAPLPFLMLLLDFYPLQRLVFSNTEGRQNLPISGYQKVTLKRAIIEKLPLFALTLFSCLITLEAHRALQALAISLPLTWRFENAIVAISEYVIKTVVPYGFAVIYLHPGRWDSTVVLRSSLFLLFLIGFLILYWRRNKFPLIGWLWFLGMLVPVSGIIQAGMQAMALRFIYFPVIGLLLAYVCVVDDLLTKIRNGEFLKKFIAATAIIICFIVSSKQLIIWQNSLSLFENTLKHTKNNFIAHCNYGLALYYRGYYSEAKEHFLDAIRIYPKFIEARINLGMVLEREGDISGAYEQYRTVVDMRHDIAFAWKSLARVASQIGKNEEALDATLKAIELNPSSDPELYFMAGYISFLLSNPSQAIKYYRKSLELNSKQPIVLNNLAWLLATLPEDELRKGQEAVSLALKANELTGGRSVIINGTLAAAYAEAGEFDKAVETAKKAIELAIAVNDKQFEEKNRELLELYLNKRAYREPLRGNP